VLLNDYGIVHSTIQTEMAGACQSGDDSDPLYCGGTSPRAVERGVAA